MLIVSMLKGITVELEEIKRNQKILMQQLQPADRIQESNFIYKHNLDVPFKTMADLQNFDRELSLTDEFRSDFVSTIDKYLFIILKL